MCPGVDEIMRCLNASYYAGYYSVLGPAAICFSFRLCCTTENRAGPNEACMPVSSFLWDGVYIYSLGADAACALNQISL